MVEFFPQGPSCPLLTFCQELYVPIKLRHRSVRYRLLAAESVRYLHEALGRPPQLADLTLDSLSLVHDGLNKAGASAQRTKAITKQLLAIHRFAVRLGYAAESVSPPPSSNTDSDTRQPQPSRRAIGPRSLPLPEGAPGTIADFYMQVMEPERHFTCTEAHRKNYYALIRLLRRWRGCDPRLEELTPAFLAEFYHYMQATGRGLNTIHHTRARLLTLWRMAHERGLAAPPPAFLPKIRVPRCIPDAWSLEELGRIVAATGRLDRESIGGIPARKFWKAILLVAYYSALRRRALLAIRRADVDLVTGWLTVPAESMKNFVGKKFRLGAEALAAVREIWKPERDLLFPMSKDDNRIKRHFDEILRLAAVPLGNHPLGRFHKMRRTTASHTAQAAGLAAASALLGHSTVQLLTRYIDPRFIVGADATTFLPPPTGQN